MLRDVRVTDILVKHRPYVFFRRQTPAVEVVRRVAAGGWQDVFPVLSEDQTVVGTIHTAVLRTVAEEPSIAQLAIADDMMLAPVIVHDTDEVSSALEILLRHDAREVVVVDDEGHVVGFLDEAEITRLYHSSTHPPTSSQGASRFDPTGSFRNAFASKRVQERLDWCDTSRGSNLAWRTHRRPGAAHRTPSGTGTAGSVDTRRPPVSLAHRRVEVRSSVASTRRGTFLRRRAESAGNTGTLPAATVVRP